ncbi:ThiF family adenylyltransferase [Lactobacillus sp. ESL0680]|uniref:ThiF family adenylyltransferase n=1 Tax=Lactobacillus sp. ESL0680 TaxID=2983210 RepID=UPI0023F6EA37|nr:ThiF family adenylyltransferase [Lactobacillus sp. ESL0680]WEV38483.1 ThiF family adenylyltransferase [Lactobacillus sp. ESL0680]
MKLKIKKTLQPLIVDNKIVFGLGNKNLIRSIPNTVSNIKLIKYLNGEIKRSDLQLSEKNITSKIKKLKEMGLLTSNTYGKKDMYSRNFNFFEWIDLSNQTDPSIYQKKLANSYVTIFGVGGVGATVAEQLVRTGVGKLKLIDFDTVDSSNITRQSTYTCSDIGKNKVDSCKQYLKSIDPNVEIITQNLKIRNKSDIANNICNNTNIIIDSIDSPEDGNKWFDEISTQLNIPVIFGSYASTCCNVFSKIPNITINYMDFLGKEKITDDCLIKHEFPTAVISPITSVAAGLVSYNTIMLLTQLRIPDQAIQIDFDGWKVLKYDIKKH